MSRYLLTFILIFASLPALAGTITLTTYYPAPSGNYKEFSAQNVGVGTNPDNPGLRIMNGAQWSSWNVGAGLVIGGPRHNGLGILDSTNSNPWSIYNSSGVLYIAQMPALGDIVTPPTTQLAVDPNGNLGIGVGSNPLYKLDVMGTVAARGTTGFWSTGNSPLYSFWIRNNSGAADEKTWVPLAVDGNQLISYIANDANSIAAGYQVVTRNGNTIKDVVFPNGNVGINNLDPQAKLHVSGNSIVEGVITASWGVAPASHGLSINGNQIWKSDTSADPNIYLQFNTNNGGIIIGGHQTAGVEDYTNNLDVRGSTTIRNNLTVGGATDLNSTLTVSGATALSNLLLVSGATAINNTLTVSGLTTINNNISVSKIGTSGFLPSAGYPGSWGGGVHTWDVYAEGSVGVGTAGSLDTLMNHGGLFAGWNAGLSRWESAIQTDGNHYGNGFFYNSDERLKKNIKPLDQALEKLMNINGVSFQWKENDKKSIGLIAQNIEKTFPELVNTDASGYKSVQYGNMVAVLIEAVKEQQVQIKLLEKRLAELDAGQKK